MTADDQNLVNLKLQLSRETDPDRHAQFAVLTARKLREIGLFDHARRSLTDALDIAPEHPMILRSLGLEMFRDGAIAEGLSLYDKGRWQLKSFNKFHRPFDAPFWRGEDIAGKRLLVWAEQGIGDQVMQARVLEQLIALGAQITLESNERIHPLLKVGKQIKCYQQFKLPDPELAAQQFDYQTSMLSAWRFVASPLSGGNALEGDHDLAARYKDAWQSMGSKTNIGLSWHSKAKASGADRSIDLSLLRPLTKISDARFHSLQYGAHDLADAGLALGSPLLNDPQSDPLVDLQRQAAQIMALDLVITIDNATAHLAGALGTPCWVLLPKASEWRWGTPQNPISLYPLTRVFRANDIGNWTAGLWRLFQAFEDEFGNKN